MWRLTTRGATIFLIVLVLSRCTARAAPPTDACSLLTPAQVGAALGGSVGPGKALANGLCQWTQQGKPGDVLLKLDVNLITPEHYARLKAVTLGSVTAAPGLGDEAFYSTFTQGRTTLTSLNVKRGAAAVTIRVSGGAKPAEEYQAKEKAVAVALVPKL
jgi:hypothetical protein